MGVRCAVLLAAAACGRLGYDPIEPIDAAEDPTCSPSGVLTCTSGDLLCDGFESSVGATFPLWNRVDRYNWEGGALDPATGPAVGETACRGSRGLHLRNVGAAQTAFLELDGQPPARVYIRLWLQIASTTPNLPFDFVGFEGDGGHFLVEAEREDGFNFNVYGFTSPLLDAEIAPFPLEVERWYCVEVRTDLDPTEAGGITLWVDGEPIYERSGVPTSIGSAPFTRTVLGVSTGNNHTDTTDVDFDDIVISPQPIGCAR